MVFDEFVDVVKNYSASIKGRNSYASKVWVILTENLPSGEELPRGYTILRLDGDSSRELRKNGKRATYAMMARDIQEGWLEEITEDLTQRATANILLYGEVKNAP